jgi:Fic family protein
MRNFKQEIDSLQENIKKRTRLTQEEQAAMRSYYLMRLAYSSNALEGSMLTLKETEVLLTSGLTPAGKAVKDTLLALGYHRAFTFMESLRGKRLIEEADACRLHRLLFEQIDPEHAGEYRQQKMFVTDSIYPPAGPEKVAMLMANLFKHLKQERTKLHPVVFAAKLHKKFSFIQPFAYGNGQIARFLMNLALLQSGFPAVIIYPEQRKSYFAALEKAHKTPYAFAAFIAERMVEAQQDYLRLLG